MIEKFFSWLVQPKRINEKKMFTFDNEVFIEASRSRKPRDVGKSRIVT